MSASTSLIKALHARVIEHSVHLSSYLAIIIAFVHIARTRTIQEPLISNSRVQGLSFLWRQVLLETLGGKHHLSRFEHGFYRLEVSARRNEGALVAPLVKYHVAFQVYGPFFERIEPLLL